MDKVAKLVIENTVAGNIDKHVASELLKVLKAESSVLTKHDQIAIIGIAAKMPKSKNIAEFWDNLRNGVDCVGKLPKNREADSDVFLEHFGMSTGVHSYIDYGYLEDIDKFDSNFFKISPKEASLMDPSQRLFLETAYEAIEDAGYGGTALKGSATGVFVGFNNWPIYGQFISQTDPESAINATAGNVPSIIASRLSFFLNLRGPSMMIDTACSSSLVAVHLACESMRKGECTTAIAGGVAINLLPARRAGSIGIDSSDGRTKSFDERSDGTGWGEGVGAVVLKPLQKALEDGDHIYAVIKGSAINQDGSSIGITAPNGRAQEEVLIRAWEDAKVDPRTITYIEAHGTGTKLGDPIEINAITKAMGKFTDQKQFCTIGSVKTNIGHLDSMAGIAGLMKAILSLKYKELPPIIHFKMPNHKIDFANSPVFVNTKLEQWNTDGFPRRCGVSAFGLSGTNSHIVLEEAPEQAPEGQELTSPAVDNRAHLFVLSAKTSLSLEMMIEQYALNLESGMIQATIGDICYTACIGRGHYAHRLALIVRDKNDLIIQLNYIRSYGLEAMQGHTYKYHKMVASGHRTEEEGTLTEAVKRNIGEIALSMTRELREMFDHSRREELLRSLCQLYLDGGDLDWRLLFQGRDYRRAILPTYAFERTRRWLKAPQRGKFISVPAIRNKNQDFNPAEIQPVYPETGIDNAHPLLEQLLLSSYEQDIFCTWFTPSRQFVLSDHRIFDKPTVPGAAWIEAVRQACKKYWGEEPIMLQDVLFHTPLIVQEGECKEVHTSLRREGEWLNFIISSFNGETHAKHAEGKVRKLTEDAPPDIYPVGIMKAVFSKQSFDRARDATSSEIVFGPRWEWIDIADVYRNDNELLFELTVSERLIDDLKIYDLHPALLDMCTTLGGSIFEGLLLPLIYEKVRIYHPLPAKCYSYVQVIGGTETRQQTMVFDISILDEHGEVCLQVERFVLKKVRGSSIDAKELAYKVPSEFYQIGWVQREFPQKENRIPNGSVILFQDNSVLGITLAKRLRILGVKVVEVTYGQSFACLNDESYVVSANQSDYDRLITALEKDRIAKIIHLSDEADSCEMPTKEETRAKLDKSAYSVFYLAKSIANSSITTPIDLIIVTVHAYQVTGDECLINPLPSCLVGLSKTVSKEMSSLRARCIDVDYGTNIDTIVAASFSEDIQVQAALRNDTLFVQELQFVKSSDFEHSHFELHNEGIYIITGGTGGLGLETALFLAAKQNIQIALLNRTKMPSRWEWDSIEAGGENAKLCHQIKMLRKIEAAGSRVSCHSIDVANEKDMEALLDELRIAHGCVRGIIHAAGVAGEGLILHKDIDKFEHVLATKVYGTLVLDYLTRNDPLDFFVLYSSVNSVFAEAGQSDYASANAFLDAYAASRSKRGMHTLAINWPAWSETGMAVDHGVNMQHGIFKAVSTIYATESLDKMLGSRKTNIIVGEFNSNSAFIDQISEAPFLLPLAIQQIIDQKKLQLSDEHIEVVGNVILTGKVAGDYTVYEQQVAQIWGQELGLEQLNVFDDYFDLGGDSIQAIKIVNSIKELFKQDVGVSDIFKYMTIHDFARFLSQKAESFQN